MVAAIPFQPSEPDARIALSTVAIAGDGLVGQAVDRFGPQAAIRLLWSPQSGDIRAVAGELGVDIGEVFRFRRRYPDPPSMAEVGTIRQRLDDVGATVMVPSDAHWPDRLGDLGPYQPLVLYTVGRADVLDAPATLGVVGTRTPTAFGLSTCRQMVSRAVSVGYTIVSGGAKGIDWSAHLEAMQSGAPQMMVVATPLDRLASWQQPVVSTLARSGVVLSETPPGRRIDRQSFLHRNRVIAALSDRIVVVEAADPSGSLNTASHARKLGRDLSAVIDRPRGPANAGCYRLVDEWGADKYLTHGRAGVGRVGK